MATTVIDATGLILGRMATHVAKRALEGDEVHIINAEKAIIAGSSKKAIQARYTFKRDVGTHRKGPFFPREPHMIVKRTVRGMMPYQTTTGRNAYKRIQAHIGIPKELAGAQSETVSDADRDPRVFMTVAELASRLGRSMEAASGAIVGDLGGAEEAAEAVPVTTDSEEE